MSDTLVRGWVTPFGDTEQEVLICTACGTRLAITCTEVFGDCPIPNNAGYWGAVPVVFAGTVKCYRCKRELSP